MFRLVAVFLLSAACAGTLRAQVSAEGSVADCTGNDLELSLHFYRAPASTHVIALNYRNRGDAPCRMRVFRHQNGTSPQLLLHNQNVEIPYPPTTVPPGGMVHSSFRWKTEPVSPDKPCEDEPLRRIVTGMPGGEVTLRSRALSPRICDWLQDDDDYHKGPFVPEWKASPDVAPKILFAPSLAVTKTNYREHEPLVLQVTLHSGAAEGVSCPVLLQTARDGRGDLRIDEVFNPEVFNPDEVFHPEDPKPADWQVQRNACPREFAFRVPLGSGAVWSGTGPRTFGIVEIAGVGSDGEYRQAASAPVTVEVGGAKEAQ